MTNALRLATRLPLLLVPLALLALADDAVAADAVVVYDRASGDPAGLTVQIGSGLRGCGAGCATLRVPARTAVGARRQAVLQFSAPLGTTIVDARLRLRYRTRQGGVVAKVQARIGGRWVDQARLRSAAAASRTVVAGRGGTAVAVVLAAESGIGRAAVRSEHDNMVAVDAVELRVRDGAPPALSWLDDPADGTWQRGVLCATVAATDAGLGVDRVEYQIGGATAVAIAPGGSRLQPRPSAFEGRPCVDTAVLADGVYGTIAAAVDTGAAGNRTVQPGAVVRVDNTPPSVEFTGPTDAEARLPEMAVAVHDLASGVERVDVQVDGFAVTGSPTSGVLRFEPPQALQDGLHKVAWQVVDAAGNRTEGSEVITVRDATAPVIDQIAPEGVAAADAVVAARVTDDGAGLAPDGVRVAVDGLDMTAAAEVGDGVLRLARPQGWTSGEHVVRVQAVDRSGNRVQREWTFTVPSPVSPTEPPGPVSDEPLAGAADAAEGVRLALQSRLRIRGASAPLAVRVTRDGEAVDGAAVLVLDARGRRVRAGVTGPDGGVRLEVPRRAAGDLRVRALGAEANVVVEAAAPVSLRSDRRSAPAGSVVRLRGRAPASAAVVVEARARGRWVAVVRLRADAAGGFETPVRLPTPGRYAVRARSGGGASEPLRLTAR